MIGAFWEYLSWAHTSVYLKEEAQNECNDIKRDQEMIKGKRVKFKIQSAPTDSTEPSCSEEDVELC